VKFYTIILSILLGTMSIQANPFSKEELENTLGNNVVRLQILMMPSFKSESFREFMLKQEKKLYSKMTHALFNYHYMEAGGYSYSIYFEWRTRKCTAGIISTEHFNLYHVCSEAQNKCLNKHKSIKALQDCADSINPKCKDVKNGETVELPKKICEKLYKQSL